jgi:hypothetical protein
LVEKDSLILADWWAIAPLGYLKYVEGLRPDVTLSPAFSLSSNEAKERHRKRGFLKSFPAVYATERLTYGMNALRQQYLLVPEGPVYRVYAENPDPASVLSDMGGEPKALFGGRLALIDWEIAPRRIGETEMFSISLYWRSLRPTQQGEQYDVLMSLERDSGPWAWREKTPLAHGMFPMSAWKPGQTLAQRHLAFIEYESEPGEYELCVRVRRRSGNNRLLPVLSPSGEHIGKKMRLGTVRVKMRTVEAEKHYKEERIASTSRF